MTEFQAGRSKAGLRSGSLGSRRRGDEGLKEQAKDGIQLEEDRSCKAQRSLVGFDVEVGLVRKFSP